MTIESTMTAMTMAVPTKASIGPVEEDDLFAGGAHGLIGGPACPAGCSGGGVLGGGWEYPACCADGRECTVGICGAAMPTAGGAGIVGAVSFRCWASSMAWPRT